MDGSKTAVENYSIFSGLRDCIIAPDLKLERAEAQSFKTKRKPLCSLRGDL
jgi:hypothetical protein